MRSHIANRKFKTLLEAMLQYHPEHRMDYQEMEAVLQQLLEKELGVDQPDLQLWLADELEYLQQKKPQRDFDNAKKEV